MWLSYSFCIYICTETKANIKAGFLVRNPALIFFLGLTDLADTNNNIIYLYTVLRQI